MRNVAIVFLVLLGALPASAEIIEGRVIKIADGDPLAFRHDHCLQVTMLQTDIDNASNYISAFS